MHKTLLLCFIHGFKGGDDTFGGFPEHLRALVSHALPKISVKAVTYPKFETRGDLKECVGRFREWLQNAVIDIEVSASTPSPTIDPSVRVILIGHSMGGIVAADTLLSITSDTPIPSAPPPSMASTYDNSSAPMNPTGGKDGEEGARRDDGSAIFMFPFIQGVLAFDTPYLGISPGVVAHGAEQHYKTATGAYTAVSEIANVFGYGGGGGGVSPQASSSPGRPRLPAAGPSPGMASAAAGAAAAAGGGSADAAAVPAWSRWGKYAMFAGAAGAVAAGGAAAYLKRDTLTEGWSWVGSHLEFVGCLMRGEELKSRVARIATLRKERGVGWIDLVTVLGKSKGAGEGVSVAGGFVEIGAGGEEDAGSPGNRRFCVVPREKSAYREFFEGAVNEKADDEAAAHMSMFTPRENPGYYSLIERAKDVLVGWVDEGWYEASERSGTGGGDIGGVDLNFDENENETEEDKEEKADDEDWKPEAGEEAEKGETGGEKDGSHEYDDRHGNQVDTMLHGDGIDGHDVWND